MSTRKRWGCEWLASMPRTLRSVGHLLYEARHAQDRQVRRASAVMYEDSRRSLPSTGMPAFKRP